MRILLGFIAVTLLLIESGRMPTPASYKLTPPANIVTVSTTKARVDFDTQIKPILKSKCMPCHFEGGKVYDRMPFDRPETIRKLGQRMFTRINEGNERRLIEDFLAQAP